jgi:ASTRA-associated protein 1
VQPSSESRDSDGWIVVWNMSTRRPLAVWRAHNASVLSIREWTCEKLVTYSDQSESANCRHGRDGKVFVWSIKEDEEARFDRGVPADGGTRRKPWLLHSLDVKEMTFCGVDVVNIDGVLSAISAILTPRMPSLLLPQEIWVK